MRMTSLLPVHLTLLNSVCARRVWHFTHGQDICALSLTRWPQQIGLRDLWARLFFFLHPWAYERRDGFHYCHILLPAAQNDWWPPRASHSPAAAHWSTGSRDVCLVLFKHNNQSELRGHWIWNINQKQSPVSQAFGFSSLDGRLSLAAAKNHNKRVYCHRSTAVNAAFTHASDSWVCYLCQLTTWIATPIRLSFCQAISLLQSVHLITAHSFCL